ncbi:MAG: two-component sensor histidine kinase, partial [Mesorhizobium sp.]
MLQRPAAGAIAGLSPTPEQLGKRARRAWLLFAGVALAIIAAALYGAGLYGRAVEVDALAAQGRTDANLKVALLRAVLENPRALPLLLSEDQQVHDALTARTNAAIDVLNRKLEGLVSGTKASVLYVT